MNLNYLTHEIYNIQGLQLRFHWDGLYFTKEKEHRDGDNNREGRGITGSKTFTL